MTGYLTTHGCTRAVLAGVGGAITAAAAVYLALGTAEPANPATATLAAFAAMEITTAGYGRQEISWSAPAGGSVSNTGAITFSFSADPPSVGYCFACDTSTGTSGTALAYWTLGTAIDAATEDQIQFAVGDLKMFVGPCP